MDEFLSSDELYHEAIETALRIEEPAEIVNMLLKIARSLRAAANPDYARALLPKILKRARELEDLHEQAYLLRLLITFQCEMGLCRDALDTLPHLEFDSDHFGVALRDIALAQVRSGLVDDALKTAERIEDLDDYETVLEAIGELQSRRRLFGDAVQTAAKMEAGSGRCRLLRSIASSRWEAGRHEEAVQTLRGALAVCRGIAEPSVRDDMMMQIVVALTEVHRVFDAMSLAKEMVDPVKRVDASCVIVLFLQQSGNPAGGCTAADDATAAARKIVDPFYRARALDRVGETLYRIGNSEEAREIFRETLTSIKEIRNTYSQTQQMIEFGTHLSRLDMNEISRRVFRLAIALAQAIEGIPFQIYSLVRIVQAQSASSLTDEAEESLALIEECRESLSRKELLDGAFDREWAMATGIVAAALCRSDEIDRQRRGKELFRHGVEIARTIADPLNRSTALQSIAEQLSVVSAENGPIS